MQDYKTESSFDITLSEEQQMSWDMLRKFAETELRPQARKTESDGMPSDDLLEKIKSLDLIPLIIPEQYGGMGLKQDSVSNALSLEALAYGDLSLAMSVSIPLLTAQIIGEHGSEEQKVKFLPEYVDGSIFQVGLGINNALISTDPYQSSVSAKELGEEIILNGAKAGVAFANDAKSFLISASNESGECDLYFVNKEQEGLELEEKEFMGLKGTPFSQINSLIVKLVLHKNLGA